MSYYILQYSSTIQSAGWPKQITTFAISVRNDSPFTFPSLTGRGLSFRYMQFGPAWETRWFQAAQSVACIDKRRRRASHLAYGYEDITAHIRSSTRSARVLSCREEASRPASAGRRRHCHGLLPDSRLHYSSFIEFNAFCPKIAPARPVGARNAVTSWTICTPKLTQIRRRSVSLFSYIVSPQTRRQRLACLSVPCASGHVAGPESDVRTSKKLAGASMALLHWEVCTAARIPRGVKVPVHQRDSTSRQGSRSSGRIGERGGLFRPLSIQSAYCTYRTLAEVCTCLEYWYFC